MSASTTANANANATNSPSSSPSTPLPPPAAAGAWCTPPRTPHSPTPASRSPPSSRSSLTGSLPSPHSNLPPSPDSPQMAPVSRSTPVTPITPLTVLSSSPSSPPSPSSVLVSSNLAVTPSALSPPSVHSPSSLASPPPIPTPALSSAGTTSIPVIPSLGISTPSNPSSTQTTVTSLVDPPRSPHPSRVRFPPSLALGLGTSALSVSDAFTSTPIGSADSGLRAGMGTGLTVEEGLGLSVGLGLGGEGMEPQTPASPSPAGCIFSSSAAETIESLDSSLISSLSALSLSLPVNTHSSLGKEGRERERRDKDAKSSPRKERKGMGAGSGAANWRRNGAPSPAQIPKADAQRVSSVNPSANSHLKPRRPTQPQSQPRVLLAQTQTHTSLSTSSSTQRGQPSSPFSSPSKRARKERQSVVIVEESDGAIGGAEEARMDVDGGEGEEKGGEGDMDVDTDGRRESGVQGDGEDEIEDWDSDSDSDDVEIYISGHGLEDLGSGLDPPPNAGGAIPADSPVLPCFPHRRHRYEKSGGSSGSVGAGAGVAGSPSIGDPTAGGQVCGGGQGQAGKRGGKSRSGSAASPTTALSKASPVTPSKDKKSKSPVTRATLASTLPSSITNSPGVNTATAAFPISSQVNTTSSPVHPAVNPTTPPINSTSFSNSSTSPSTSLSVQADSTPASGLLSPALPPAPTRQTIPLPEVDVGASFDVGFDGSMEFNRSAGLGTDVQLQSSLPTFDDCDASFVTCANEPSFGLDGNRNTADPDRTPRKAVPLAESTTKRSTSAWAPAHVSSASQLDINNLHSNAKPEAMKMGVPKKMKTNVNPHTNTHAKSNTNASGSGMSNNSLSLMINDTDESLMDVFDPVASSTPQSANATFEEEQEQEAEEESMYFDAQSGYQDVHGDGYQRNVEGRYPHMRRYGQSADTSRRGLGMVDVDMGGGGSRNANITGNAGAHSSWRGGDEGWMEGSSRGGGRATVEPSPTTSHFPSLTDSVFSLRPHRPQHSQLSQQYVQHHDLQDENPTYEGPHSPVNYHPSNQNTLQHTSNSQQLQHNPHSEKTPNVYINGLPPHFPEDQLFALASPYGEIRSVRTFTRHVRDSESGYGFVLFETIDGAERCITALRKYRNLHPTFSKQIHKIPGTPYAHVQTPLQNALAPSQSSDGGPAWEGACPGEESASFKAKMESLHDPTSTNLYMEGLPLSIDEPTLAALVAPHRINSSRFFQTRLSNPPRIIAFVRLETRAGAEEIVERLHGRMVRGWNDSGSRISVRFADTSEQRELRRAERAAKDGDPSLGRLTIAQAALLNLHGQDLRNKGTAAPVATPLRRGQARAEISPNTPYRALPSEYDQGKQKYDHTQPPFAVDYSLAPGRPKPNTSSPFRPYAPLPLVQLQIPSGPTITSIVDPLHGSDVPFHPNQECVDEYSGYDQQYLPDTQGLPSRHTKPAHTRTGYTAAEEYIMRAHAEALNLHAQAESFQQQQRRKPAPLELIRHQEAGESAAGHRRDDSDDSVNIAMGMRAYRAQASAIAYPSQHRQQQQRTSPAVRGRQLPNMSEEFHATASEAGCVQKQPNRLPQFQSVPKQMHNSNIHPPHVNARLGRGADYMNDITSLQYQEERQQQTHYHNRQHSHQTQQYEHQQQQRQSPPQPFSPEVSEYDYHNTHTRSTTHPHRTTSNLHQHRHFQHNSMSVLSSNTSSNLSNNNMYNHEQQLADTIVNNDRSSVGNNTDINTNTNTYNYENSKPQTHLHRSSAYQDHPHQSSDVYDQSDSLPSPSFISPSLVSPSLTFSPHTPASTLSPATPFFGSFSSAAQIAEAFADRVQIGIGLGNPGGEDLMMQKNSKIRTESH